MSVLDAKIPEGTLEQKWTKYRSTVPLVNPSNKRNLEVIVVGSGLAGASAAASVSKILHVVLTQLQHKVVSTQQKIIKMMVTLFTVYFTIQLKVVTIEQEKQTYIV